MAVSITCDVPGCGAKVNPETKIPKEYLDMASRVTGKHLKDYCGNHVKTLEKLYTASKELLGQKVDGTPKQKAQKPAATTTVAGSQSAPVSSSVEKPATKAASAPTGDVSTQATPF